jgi:hypothetical protein
VYAVPERPLLVEACAQVLVEAVNFVVQMANRMDEADNDDNNNKVSFRYGCLDPPSSIVDEALHWLSSTYPAEKRSIGPYLLGSC